MGMNDLDTRKRQLQEALDSGDFAAADEVLLSLPDELRPAFDEWIASLAPAPTPVDAAEAAAELRLRGVDERDAAMLGALAAGSLPPAVLVADAMAQARLDADAVSERLVAELRIGDEVVNARGRIARAVRNIATGREGQSRRLAPDAVDALARVLGGSAEQFRRAFEAAAQAARGGMAGAHMPAGALAREGADGVVLPDDLAAEDDDLVDELFYRSQL